ncbi:MAG: 2-oxoacid:acceptor oxidoreductase family protein [Oscillospiraceae bacterium]|jgi:2-oxoglutarate ferredoxin oxidoreductase subunit gamma|nr:2-oxoacid:acceptor oxidoreductase family protein [Oscillospiraceae bacterium]
MEKRILIAGFGGQGVLLMGQLLSKAGMHEDMEVCWMPSYGPEMRGGEANCGVILADEPIGSPLVAEPDVAILMNRPSLDKFEPSITPGGVLLYNSSLIDVEPKRSDVKIYAVPCNDIAVKIGNARVANMVMLGAFNALTNLLPMDSLLDALRQTLGAGKERLIPINQQALTAGAESVA